MEKRIELGLLADFYGPLLSGRQRGVVALYTEEDMTVSEIAQCEGITRQAVNDALTKAEAQLLQLEGKLGLLARYQALQRAQRICREKLLKVVPKEGCERMYQEALSALDSLEELEM